MSKRGLRELARLYGVQTSYRDAGGTLRTARDEPLLRALACLGVPVRTLDDVRDALREQRRSCWRRALEPVAICVAGQTPELLVRVPAQGHSGSWRLTVPLDGGAAIAEGKLEELEPVDAEDLEGERFVAVRVKLGRPLPPGYHRATLALPSGEHTATILCTPPRAYAPRGRATPLWGVFAPLWGLRQQRSRGTGDLTDLGAAIDWVAGLGGGMVGTLPLGAATPGDPSPYAPMSRIFWNEAYLDLEAIPEARAALARDEAQKEIARLRGGELYDPEAQIALAHRVLDEALPALERDSKRREALKKWLAGQPHAEAYAKFRAAGARHGQDWSKWPEAARGGRLGENDGEAKVLRRHLFAQLLFAEQLGAIGEKARAAGQGLFLDLPLGVHPSGFDPWRFPNAFLPGAAAGAPPDILFTKGQNWGFAPLHPEGMREDGYAYVAATLQAHLRHAGMLRIDHVMSLYRLFIVPTGMENKDGVYIRYREDELYAVLCIESQAHRSMIIGEDLGTVPPAVKAAMAKYDVHGLHVVEYELPLTGKGRSLKPAPRRTIASINTHDMPMWAAYWAGDDIGERLRDGLLDEAAAEKERAEREEQKRGLVSLLRIEKLLDEGETLPDAKAVHEALLIHLARSPARGVMVTLEDLWGERRPQNVPGTGAERANWRRPLRHTLDEMKAMPEVRELLTRIDAARRAAK